MITILYSYRNCKETEYKLHARFSSFMIHMYIRVHVHTYRVCDYRLSNTQVFEKLKRKKIGFKFIRFK